MILKYFFQLVGCGAFAPPSTARTTAYRPVGSLEKEFRPGLENTIMILSFRTDSAEQSDQGLHCLLFRLHLLDVLLYGKAALFKF